MPRHNRKHRKGGAARTAGRDESTRTSLRIADELCELMARRRGEPIRQREVEKPHEPVVIASLWQGCGIAYVKLDPRDRSTTFRWGRNYWKCFTCGDLDGFTCEHGLRIPDSRALRQAEKARGITRTPKRKRNR